jgi:hypothetical protein
MLSWLAVYKDNKQLSQFSKGKERLFKEIDLDKVKEFILIREEDMQLKDTYSVNMVNGSFWINKQKIDFECNIGTQELKLIYFKRVRRNLGGGDTKITYCIGWENRDNPTTKRIMKVTEEGSISFETKN